MAGSSDAGGKAGGRVGWVEAMKGLLLRPKPGPKLAHAYGVSRRLFNAGASVPVLAFVLVLVAVAPAWAEPLKVLTFGDSLSAGYGVQPEEAFPAKLEAALKARGLDVVVKDASVSGDTTAGGVVRLNWALSTFEGSAPDLVIVEFGGNDMLRGLDPDKAKANLDTILTELKSRGVKALLAGMRAAPNLGPEYVARFDGIYRALADAHGVPLYPFFLEGVAGKPELIQADGLHPNPKGVDVIVAGIAPLVAEALRKPGA
jgi:acyl-CoA thioesterase-1